METSLRYCATQKIYHKERNQQVLENRDMVEDLEFIIFVVQTFGQNIVCFLFFLDRHL